MTTERSLFEFSALAAADYGSNRHYCVELTSEGSAGAPPTVTIVSSAGSYAVGVLIDEPEAAGRGCTIRRLGTCKIVAGAAISFGAELTTDSSGRVVTRTSNAQAYVGEALDSATAAGDKVEVLLQPAKAAVEVSKGVIPLPLATARELATNDIPNIAANGGLLASDTTPVLDAINAGTDQQLQLTWAASNSDKVTWGFVWPDDLDPAEDVTFHCKALSGGATDTPAIAVEAFEGVGDTDFGGNTGALGASLAEVTRTLAAANVGGAPNNGVITIAPGAHTTDTAVIQGDCWLEYTRK